MVKSLKYKHQDFQMDAVESLCDLFIGQPYSDAKKYIIDKGSDKGAQIKFDIDDYGFKNAPLIPELTDEILFKRVNTIQIDQRIISNKKFEGLNFTTQMETGTGKTYVYIRSIFELNKRYGWSKFIIIVPSIAIREGVKSAFDSMQEHFAQDYGKKARFFVYNSSRLSDINSFANENSIQVMIINSQAFNATGADARRIYMELDEFGSRRPIDVISGTNPILIIDEPQSVEGEKTKVRLKEFKPLFTLRYSATHKAFYNLIYRLDSMDAYNKKLVKSITVIGMSQLGSRATDGYVYLESISAFKDKPPVAHIGFEKKETSKIARVVQTFNEKDNLYYKSNNLDQYKNGYTITEINKATETVTFTNGLVLHSGDMVGDVNNDVIRRMQIRETIIAHIEKESELYSKGIKVLSLFFIDEVSNYRQWDDTGSEINGLYGRMFEEEYETILNEKRPTLNKEYLAYLDGISPPSTHKGYFSVDKKGRYTNSKIKRGEGDGITDDVDAYDLIMSNKTLLLDLKNNVRFIFSHSALREGWDNPNVFQICTLKEGGDSDIRKMQEVGRGLRLCVNQNGERMDESVLGADVQRINELTVIASESYESFTRSIQNQIAEAIGDRPTKVTSKMFIVQTTIDGKRVNISEEEADDIFMDLVVGGYIDKTTKLPTDKYYEAKEIGELDLSSDLLKYTQIIFETVDTVTDPSKYVIKNGRENNIIAKVNEENLEKEEFLELWNRINRKSAYTVNFDTEELIRNCVASLDEKLRVSKVMIEVKKGNLEKIESKDSMESGNGFSVTESEFKTVEGMDDSSSVKYDLIGKIVEGTNLTRATVADILKRIKPETFNMFQQNPEIFIINTILLINNEKATMIIQSIEYHPLDESYSTEIFTSVTLKGKLDENMMESKKNVFDFVQYDSKSIEKPFAKELENDSNVVVYAKLPVRDNGFKISTPVGNYTPDWVIAFKEGSVKHIYFVAETKGSLNSMELKGIEDAKIACAKKHFEKICGNAVKYDFVTSFKELMDLVG